MKKQLFQTLATILFLSLLLACSGSKRMTKKGDKLAEAGLHDQAFGYYDKALNKKPSNVKAIIGFKNTSQIVLDDLLSDFFRYKNENNHREVVYTYRKAKKTVDIANKHSVKLNIPSHHEADYKKSLAIYLERRYKEAKSELAKEAFKESSKILSEIHQLDAGYKDVAELLNYSDLEPVYRSAKTAYENKRFREAYHLFSRITSYKDSKKMQKQAKKEATFSIAILPVKVERGSKRDAESINSSLIKDLNALRDPFIKILDRSLTDKILREQHFSLSNAVNAESAVNAGELLGAKVLLYGKLIRIDKSFRKQKPIIKKGYVASQKRLFDKETGLYKDVTNYTKTNYEEHSGKSSVRLVYSYQLISTETGETLLSDHIEIEKKDEVNYAKFDGKHELLFPGIWADIDKDSRSDIVYTEVQQVKPFRDQFKERSELKKTSTLQSEIIKELCAKISSAIAKYNPES